jgi:hypothetical protein
VRNIRRTCPVSIGFSYERTNADEAANGAPGNNAASPAIAWFRWHLGPIAHGSCPSRLRLPWCLRARTYGRTNRADARPIPPPQHSMHREPVSLGSGTAPGSNAWIGSSVAPTRLGGPARSAPRPAPKLASRAKARTAADTQNSIHREPAPRPGMDRHPTPAVPPRNTPSNVKACLQGASPRGSNLPPQSNGQPNHGRPHAVPGKCTAGATKLRAHRGFTFLGALREKPCLRACERRKAPRRAQQLMHREQQPMPKHRPSDPTDRSRSDAGGGPRLGHARDGTSRPERRSNHTTPLTP